MCSTEQLELPIDEILANQIALAAEKDRKREEAMEKLRGAVNRAIEFDVTLTGTVLADACKKASEKLDIFIFQRNIFCKLATYCIGQFYLVDNRQEVPSPAKS